VLDASNPTKLLFYAEIRTAFNAVIRSSPAGDALPLRTKRFVRASELLLDAALAEFTSAVASCATELKSEARTQLSAVMAHSGSANAVAADLLTKVLYRCVLPALSVPGSLKAQSSWVSSNATELLLESSAAQAERAEAERKLRLLEQSMATVSQIDTAAAGLAPFTAPAKSL
jgi:hypothetical protein